MEVKNHKTSLVLYGNLLSDIKTRIRQAQVKATLSANSEMILMYWDIGRMIQERQDHEGWGTAVIPRLSRDIRNELPEEKGFSERNIKRMLRFYREYPNILPIMPQAVAQLQQAENKDLKLRCFIVIELNKGDFKPEYAGKMNFYLSAVDDLLRHNDDQPSIGIILCKAKNKVIVEYALRDTRKPIGVSGYKLTETLPKKLKGSLPSIKELEESLSASSTLSLKITKGESKDN